MAETKKKKAQSVADNLASINEDSGEGIEIAAAPTDAETIAPNQRPTPDEIARRAYEIYLERGGSAGSAEDDWLQAERELGGINDEGEDIS
jgi:Protein of unknown function (DUF2934)